MKTFPVRPLRSSGFKGAKRVCSSDTPARIPRPPTAKITTTKGKQTKFVRSRLALALGLLKPKQQKERCRVLGGVRNENAHCESQQRRKVSSRKGAFPFPPSHWANLFVSKVVLTSVKSSGAGLLSPLPGGLRAETARGAIAVRLLFLLTP